MFTNKRRQRARNLIYGANVMAISNLELFVDEVPTVGRLLSEGEDVSSAWDFFTPSPVSAQLFL